MAIRNFKFLQKEKEPQFQFRNAQLIATQLVEGVYDNGTYRNLREVQPHITNEGTYHITDFNILMEDGLTRIESTVSFIPHTPIRDITLNISFTDHNLR